MFLNYPHIVQGSKEWLDMRLEYLTASQLPILFGQTKWNSLEDLIEEKVLRKSKEGFVSDKSKRAMADGHRLEDVARSILRDYSFKPAVITSTIVPGLMASLDGEHDGFKIILEAKYTGNKTKFRSVRKGIIPRDHYIQMQAQLFCSGAEHCLYWMTDKKDITRQIVKPDLEMFKRIAEEVPPFLRHIKELRDERERRKSEIKDRINGFDL